MKRFVTLVFLLVAVLCFGASLKSFRIAVVSGASLAESNAAAELQEYVERCSGVKLPIVEYETSLEGPLFVVGQSEESWRLWGISSVEEFRPDEIALKSVGERLYICGARPRGTLYGVYEFLEKSLGVMWLATDATVTPSCDGAFEVPSWDYRYAPDIYIRSYGAQINGSDQEFHAHTRQNGAYQPSDERLGGCKDVTMAGAFVHTFQHILPPETYFKAHPEWYAYRKDFFEKSGRNAKTQLCLTNQEMRVEFIRRTLEMLESYPDYGMVSISQNDNIRFCQCKECTSFVEQYGNQADLYLDFVNQVAEAVEKAHPRMLVETPAYRFTRHPPKTVRPRENVIIRSCTIEAASMQTIEGNQGPNKKLYDDFMGWKPFTKQIMVWDYVTVFRKYWQPHPNWGTLAENLRFFRDCKAISVFEQGPTNGGGRAADLPELRGWVLCKLMWNPDQDVWTLINQFLPAYYGPEAAPFIGKTIRAFTALAKGADNCYTVTTRGWLPDEVLQEAWLEGEELYQKNKDHPVYGSRIMAAIQPLAMSALERGFTPPEPWTFETYADDLLNRLQKLEVKTLAEHDTEPSFTPEIWRKNLK